MVAGIASMGKTLELSPSMGSPCLSLWRSGRSRRLGLCVIPGAAPAAAVAISFRMASVRRQCDEPGMMAASA
eukprot:scaffold214334_cov30-Tisochrysis_lutea.AAC.1